MSGSVTVYFAPQDEIASPVVEAINHARRRVWLAGYSFTLPAIAQAIAKANDRGLDVRVVLDRSNVSARYSGATYLSNHRVPLWIDSQHAIFHHKVLLVDDDLVGLGSANFSKAAMGGEPQGNAENFNIFTGAPALASIYQREFLRLAEQANRQP